MGDCLSDCELGARVTPRTTESHSLAVKLTMYKDTVEERCAMTIEAVNSFGCRDGRIWQTRSASKDDRSHAEMIGFIQRMDQHPLQDPVTVTEE